MAEFLYENDLVSFTYNGGSNPGATRTVLILKAEGNNYRAWDFDREDARTFNPAKMSNIRFPEHKALSLDILPESLNVTELAAKYQKDGYKTFVNGETLFAVKVKKPRFIEGRSGGILFSLGHKTVDVRANQFNPDIVYMSVNNQPEVIASVDAVIRALND